MLVTVRNLLQKQLLTKKTASFFIAIVAIATTTTEMARDDYTLQLLTTVSYTIPTTRSLNLTSYLAKPSLQVEEAICVKSTAKTRNQNIQKRENGENYNNNSANKRQR